MTGLTQVNRTLSPPSADGGDHQSICTYLLWLRVNKGFLRGVATGDSCLSGCDTNQVLCTLVLI